MKNLPDPSKIKSPLNPAYRPELASTPQSHRLLGKNPKTEKELGRDRAVFSLRAISRLEGRLIELSPKITSLFESGAIAEELANRTMDYFELVCKTLDQAKSHKEVGAPRTLKNARGLLRATSQFRSCCEEYLGHNNPYVAELVDHLKHLCGCVTGYGMEIQTAYSIVRVVNGRPILPNRKTNWLAKEALLNIVEDHRKGTKDKSFPKLRNIRAQLKQQGLPQPDSTIRYWRKQIEQGTFDDFIQPNR